MGRGISNTVLVSQLFVDYQPGDSWSSQKKQPDKEQTVRISLFRSTSDVIAHRTLDDTEV